MIIWFEYGLIKCTYNHGIGCFMEVLASYDCSALYSHIHYSFDMHAQLSCNESIKLSYLNLPIYLLRPFSANHYLMHTKFIHYRCNEISEQQNLVHWRMADFWPLSLYYINFRNYIGVELDDHPPPPPPHPKKNNLEGFFYTEWTRYVAR